MNELCLTNHIPATRFFLRATGVAILFCIISGSGIQSAIAVQTVAKRVAQQEEPFIDTSEWVQSTSPFGDAYDQNYITETIVRGYRGPGSDQSSQPFYRNEALEFSKENKIQPIHYASNPSQQTDALQRNILTSVNYEVSEPSSIRPIPDASINGGDNVVPSNRQFANGHGFATNPYGQLDSPAPFASQASYGQPVYSNASYPQSSYNQPQTYFASNVTSTNSYPYQNSSAYGGYPANYLPTNYATSSFAPQTNSLQYRAPQYGAPAYAANAAPQYAYTSMLTNCCDPVYQPTQFTTPNINPNPSALQTYPQYGASNYGFGGTQPYQRTTWVPVIPLRSMPYGTYLGQGIIGQPVAYVDGEPVRNFVRYIFP